MTHSRAALALLPVLFTAAACGGSDDPADGADDAAADCSTAVDVTDVATGETTALETGGAVSLAGGSAYTLYAADYDLDMDDVTMAAAPVPPEGSQLVTVAITVFNAVETPEPLAVGDTISAGTQDGERVFVVTHNVGAELRGNSTGATGTVEVTEAGPSVCVDVDYEDGEKIVSGTIAAEVKEM